MSALKENFRAILLKDSTVILIGMFVLFFLIMVFSQWDHLSGSETGFVWLGFSGLFFVGMAGQMTGGMMIEFMTHPLGFLLPGYCRVMRTTVFALAFGFCGLFSLLSLLSGNLDFLGHLRVLFSVLFAELTIFWLGVVASFSKKTISLLFAGFLVWVILGEPLVDNNGFVARVISEYFMIPITVGVVTCRIAWALLGREDLLRIAGRRNWGQVPRQSDPEEKWRYARQKNRQGPIRPGWLSSEVERFFLGRIHSCRTREMTRFLWGQLYIALTPPTWSGLSTGFVFIAIPAMILAFGYIGNGMLLPLCFIFLPILCPPLPAYSHRITIGGRQERFVATVTNTAVIAGIVTALIVAAALLTIPLSWIIPDFTLGGDLWSYHAVSLRFWYGALLILPLTHTLLILVPELLSILSMLGLVLITFLMPSFMIAPETEPTRWEYLVAAGLIAFNGWVFVLACRMVCTKWSLVRN